jgi:hypothetical protein
MMRRHGSDKTIKYLKYELAGKSKNRGKNI